MAVIPIRKTVHIGSINLSYLEWNSPSERNLADRLPIDKRLIDKRPVANLPIANLPVAKRPVANLPVAKRPIAKRPIANLPVANLPVAKLPIATKLPVDKLPVDREKKIPVLLLHGLGDHAGVWQPLANALAPEHLVVAPDLRGHGDSDKPETGYDCDQMIGDLTALMEHLGWPSAHIVGHSWAGKLTCIWAHRNPERFNHLVLVDPAFTGQFPSWTRLTFPLFYRLLPFLKMLGPFQSYDDAETQAKELKQYRGWSDYQQQVFQDSIEQKQDGTWGSKFCTSARDGVFEDFTQVAGLTGPITVPTLFVQPTQGLNRSSIQLKPYKRYIHQLTINTVPGHHWAFLAEPDGVSPLVTDFLKP